MPKSLDQEVFVVGVHKPPGIVDLDLPGLVAGPDVVLAPAHDHRENPPGDDCDDDDEATCPHAATAGVVTSSVTTSIEIGSSEPMLSPRERRTDGHQHQHQRRRQDGQGDRDRFRP